MKRFAIVVGVAFWATGSAAYSADEKAIDFNRDIRPILSDNCYRCHGPDAAQRQAGLRLDLHERALAPADSGAKAIVPGKSSESALIARITASDATERMPPASTGKQLTPQQIDRIRRWIDAGAPWKDHWSFLPPVRPEPPAVDDASQVRNPIDRFVVARLAKERLAEKLSPPADKTTLARRVTFDLTGLPPTPAEMDAFVNDASPDAYEQLVARLLRSPRYGEHMARYWLDVARYGDTHGLHLDNERAIWKYREWVINAYNRNQPFDQFTIEQIAGDLLPDATLEQRIATGFNRCNVSTSEGGSINEEVQVRYAVDRTETTSTVWMGLTLGCAVCHDHKFDPISQTEFYRLYAFFNSTADAAMDGNQLSPPPTIKLPTTQQTQRLAEIDRKVAELKKQTSDELAKIEYVDPGADGGTPAPTAPADYVWIEDSLPPGANAQGNTPWEFVGKPDHPVYSGEKCSTRTAEGLSQHFFTNAKPGLKIGEEDKLFAYVYLDPANPPKSVMLQFNDGQWEHRAFWGDDQIPFGSGDTPAHRPMGKLPEVGKWVRLEVEAAKVGLKAGAVLNGWAFTQFGGKVYWDQAGVHGRTPQVEPTFESQLAWEAFEKARQKSDVPKEVTDVVKVDADKRNDAQKATLRDYFLQHVCAKTRDAFQSLAQKIEALNKERTEIDKAIPTTLVMADMPQLRDTFLLIRGAYDKKGDKVAAGVPAVLSPLPADAPLNRLGLARWLVDPSHPLTARVTINRLWQQFFGRGIVKTAEDFGSQGEWPTHPELLDWLSTELISRGWDVKHMVRLIVTSAAYRQSSKVTTDLYQRDPENAFLARGPRFRLDAEVVRDTALSVSGLLVEKLGGPSVKPYQPPGIWEAVAFVGSNTRDFKRDAGEALYRRSMYTFWKRTSPPPGLTTFDAPSRETCVARRARTNTPLQALALMNDEQYVEASRRLAARLMREGGARAEDRLSYGFRLVTARPPEAKELDVLLRVYRQQLEHYQAHAEAATKLLAIGESKRDEGLDAREQAAWTMMANLLLNLDETITKE